MKPVIRKGKPNSLMSCLDGSRDWLCVGDKWYCYGTTPLAAYKGWARAEMPSKNKKWYAKAMEALRT